MKNSLIFKILLILSLVIVTTFAIAAYIFSKSDEQLISEIRSYNLNSAMKALDARLEERLNLNKQNMEDILLMINKNSKGFLLDYDVEGLKKSIEFDMKKQGVVAVSIWDGSLQEYFLCATKQDSQIKFSKQLDSLLIGLVKLEKEIQLEDGDSFETLGKTTLYYDESIIRKKIEQLKKSTLKSIENFDKIVDEKKSYFNMVKIIIAIVAMVSILILLSILFIKFVNKPLKTLQKGLDDFFAFLQNKKDHINKMEIDSDDEFGQMAKELNNNIEVSAKLHEEIYELNTNLERRIEEKTSKVTTLLDNAGQGFLTFDRDFVVDEEYSRECEKLLGEDIAYKDIASLIFSNKADKQELFKTSLINAINETELIKRNAYISLLPSIVLLNKKAVKLEYKILNDQQFMLVLTNITSQKKLERKIKKEQQTLKMIVAVVSESEVFYELKKEYEYFIKEYKFFVDMKKTPLHNITTLYRTVHTFKGTFSQLFIQEIVDFLHELESDIATLQKDTNSTNEDLLELLESCDFESSLESALDVIVEILGKEFLESDNYLKVDISDISSLQDKIQMVLNNHNETSPECKDILCQVQNLSSQKLMNLLQPYISSSLQLANRLEKDIYEFEIIGDKNINVAENFKPFIKSLIHVFRNSIDHGIETPEIRVEKNKDEYGTIACSFELDHQNDLHLIISDDGQGIDEKALQKKLEEKGIDTSVMSKEEIILSIFDDNVSTKKDISDISGRGVGLSAVKYEVEKLNGKIHINSQKEKGTTFEFVIPMDN